MNWEHCECGCVLMGTAEDAGVPRQLLAAAASECVRLVLPALVPVDRRFTQQILDATEAWASGAAPVESLQSVIDNASARAESLERELAHAESRSPKRNPYSLPTFAEFRAWQLRDRKREHANKKKRVKIDALLAALFAAESAQEPGRAEDAIKIVVEVLAITPPPLGVCTGDGYSRSGDQKSADIGAASARCATAVRRRISPSKCPELTSALL